MLTPRENAVKFAGIWNMERPQSVHIITPGESDLIARILQEEGILFPKNMEGRESRLYGGSADDFARRGDGEYAQRVLENLLTVLEEGAYISDKCKKYLIDHLKTSMSLGLPASLVYPLEDLGITLDAERYGIFDPNANVQQIEAELMRSNGR